MIWWFSTSATVVAKLVWISCAEFDEGGLVEADGAGLVQAFAIGLKEGLAIGDHGVVDRVPVTGQLVGHF